MFPNSYNGNQFWEAENFALGATIFDWRPRFSDLPEEVKAYLTEHENEIRSAGEVERLVRTYEMKK